MSGEAGGSTERAREVVLELYGVAGSPSTERARANLQAALDRLGAQPRPIVFVDVLAEPERAFAAGVLATPLLVLRNGTRAGRIAGTLDQGDRLHAFLARLT